MISYIGDRHKIVQQILIEKRKLPKEIPSTQEPLEDTPDIVVENLLFPSLICLSHLYQINQ